MISKMAVLTCAMFVLSTAALTQGQQATSETGHAGKHAKPNQSEKHGRSAGAEMASGAGNIGKGVGKGAGSLAVGTGKGAVDLATLHPIDAAVDVGKGGAAAGTHIAVGTVKGTAKIPTGVGKGIKHIF